MEPINTCTAVYYKKLTYLLCAIIASILCFAWVCMGKESFTALCMRSESSDYVYVLRALFGILFFGAMAYDSIRKLLHIGPAYIISPQGIMDCTRRKFIPWSEVKNIWIDRSHKYPSNKTIALELKHAEDHFGGKWKALFSAGHIRMSPKLMWYEEREVFDCSSSGLKKIR